MGMIYPILDGQDVFDTSQAKYTIAKAAKARVRGLTNWVDDRAVAAPAFVNHNRWLAACPDCGSAVYVWRGYPTMVCLECWNAGMGGRWRRVEWPGDLGAIEAALARRPIPQTRNWHPPESVDDLWRENQEHGLGGASC